MKKFLLLLLCLPLFQGCILVYSNFDFSNELKPLHEQTLAGSGRDRILMVDVSGEIMDRTETGIFGLGVRESMVAFVREQLKLAKTDPRIKAVLVKVNSPGGTVTASDILYREFKAFREEQQIPLYVSMVDVAASGGYYIAMAADHIDAHPTTVTGSIGVIMFNLSFEGLMKKIGVSSKVIKSGKNKDIGSPLKDLKPEERKILQSVIDDLHQRFVTVVESGRPNLSKEAVRKAADGRVYTAQQAKDLGLVDNIAYLPETIENIKRDLKLEKAKVIVYKRPHQQISNIYSRIQSPLPKGVSLLDPELTRPLKTHASPQGFYYLWQPGQ